MKITTSKKKRILIVDDDTTNLQILARITQGLGHDVIPATTGKTALAALDESVDMVLLDVMMPDMSGFEVLTEIRSNNLLCDLPVIMVTALTARQDRLTAVEAGANDFISKPIDMTELEIRMRSLLRFKESGDELKRFQKQSALTARLEAIGQLAAGIAHEINTPAQYVSDSFEFVKETCADFIRVMVLADKWCHEDQQDRQGPAASMRALLEEVDSQYIFDELPKTFDRIFCGISRISNIVQAMKRFSCVGGVDKACVDINESIKTALVVANSELLSIADIATELDPSVASVSCIPGEINQVLLNIIVNAAHAVAEVVQGTTDKGKIIIKTRRVGNHAEISIKDTGPGIPENIRDKVFHLFFTTKEVGKGTGQGLAISYDIIVNKHGGTIDFESEEGAGTTFYIRLPFEE